MSKIPAKSTLVDRNSQFIARFGDPINNPMGFDTIAGKKLFSLSSGKFLPDVKRQSHGYPVYGGNGVAWYTDAALIDHPTIVIGRVGAYCGNVKVVKEPVWITDNAIYITRILSDRISLDFLYHLMSYLDLPRFADYVGQPKITQKPLESLEYIVPPKEAQDSFVSFVQQSDKSKFAALAVSNLNLSLSLDFRTPTLWDSGLELLAM